MESNKKTGEDGRQFVSMSIKLKLDFYANVI